MRHAHFPLTATRSGVRATLAPDEKTTLESVRDKLTSALAGIKTALGANTGSTIAAVYAKANYHVRNTLDGEERKAIEAARDDVTAALTNVRTLLGEPAPTEQPSKAQSIAASYAALNAKGSRPR